MLFTSWSIQEVDLLYSDSEARHSTGIGKTVDESLKRLLGVPRQNGIFYEEHLAYDNLPHFGFGTKVGQVQDIPIAFGLEVHSVD